MKIRVFFDVMRHGEKDLDQLTPKGFEQVKASAKANLNAFTYIAAFYSGMSRTKQTVETALQAIGQAVCNIRKEWGFGYLWAEDPKWPIGEALDRVIARVSAGEAETAALWIEEWPVTRAIRGRFIGTLEKWALHFAEQLNRDLSRGPIHPDMDVPKLRVLVGSHSPTSELACLDPASTPRLREADGITYCMEVDTVTLEVTMISSEVWRRPDDV